MAQRRGDPGLVSQPRAGLGPGGWARVAGRLGALLGWLGVCVPAHYLTRLITSSSPVPPRFLAGVAWIVGARVERRGQPAQGRVLYLANHISWLDIPALAGATGTAFVAKDSLAAAPLVGWLSRLNRTVFIPRDSRMEMGRQLALFAEALEQLPSVTLFPEATTGDGLSVRPFKSAMLQVLDPPPPGVRVQPVWIDYGELVPWIGWVGEESGVANALRLLGRRGRFPLRLHFLPPFAPEDAGDRKAIAQRGQAAVEAAQRQHRSLAA